MGKTMIFKAFWLAHLYYYSEHPRSYLTDWPIVRMPYGPGIDSGEKLLLELMHDGKIEINHRSKGPFTEINCRLTRTSKPGDLSEAAIKAIRDAVEYVTTHTTRSISDLSHEFSRSWSQTPNGSELDIYTDLIPDDVYEERRQELLKLNEAYDKLIR
jgi:hypothetical protein